LGMVPLRHLIASTAKTYVHSVALCDSFQVFGTCPIEDQANGFLMSMDRQVDQFARAVRADPKLVQGFHAVGFSQGNLVIRGYLERYNDPPVRTHLSMHGPMMGVASLPKCPLSIPGLASLCKAVDDILDLGVYSSIVQNHLAQANYYRFPPDLATYRKQAHFLPSISNEGKDNATYTANFKSLERLVLVMAKDDTMVHPKESEHFGFFAEGPSWELVSMRDAPWYAEDWFGLKTLDMAGKIDHHTTPGDHLRFTQDFLVAMVQKYFMTSVQVPSHEEIVV